MGSVEPVRPKAHLAGLDGLRAAAALGILVTHVAFQSGASRQGVGGALLARLDLAVAVFFALSGFLLWRPWADAAARRGPRPQLRAYLVHRVARIMPAYLLLVVLVLWLLPENRFASASTWIANLTLTQVFVPLTLSPGLTHLWSLSVEVAFYLVLPLLGWLLARTRGRVRLGLIGALGASSLGWPWLREAAFPGVQADLWLPALLPWFLVGVALAELAVSPPAWLRSAPRRSGRWLLLAATGFVWASTPLGGSTLLTAPAPAQAATKTVLGCVLALGLLAPLALGGSSGYQRALSSTPARVLGRWSYGIFLWHLAVLALVFPVLGVTPFTGRGVLLGLATLVLTLPVAAASYALVEEPARRAARDALTRRRGSAASPSTSSALSTSS